MFVRDGKRRKCTIIEHTGPHTATIEYDDTEQRVNVNSDKIFYYKPLKSIE